MAATLPLTGNGDITQNSTTPANGTYKLSNATAGNNGNLLTIEGSNGNGTDRNGGNILIRPGVRTGSGTDGLLEVDGNIKLTDPANDRVWATEKTFNVLDYGADGSCTNNSRMQIQDAINDAANRGGGVVFIPSGTYRIESVTGTVTTTSTTQLIDASGNFSANNIKVGDVVINYTRGCAAVVDSIVSTTTLALRQIDSTNRIIGNLGNNQFTQNDKYCIAGLVIKRNVHLKGQEGSHWKANLKAYGVSSFTVITADPSDTCGIGYLPFKISDLTITRDDTVGQWNTAWMMKGFGDGTTYIDITKTGSMVQYAYNSGTVPNFATNGMKSGDIVVINVSTFNDMNNGTFIVSNVTDAYFEVVNSDGVDQATRVLSSASDIQSACRDYDHAINAFNYRIWSWGIASPCNFATIERVLICGSINPYAFTTGIRLACWFDASIVDCMVSYCRTGIDISMPGSQSNSVNILNCQVFDNLTGIRLAGMNNKVIGGQIMSDIRVNTTFISVDKDAYASLPPTHTNYICGVSFEGAATDIIGIHLKPGSEATTVTGCWFNLAGPGIRPAPGKIEIKDNSNGRNNILANYYWGSYCGDSNGWANADWKAASNLMITGEGARNNLASVDNAGSSTTVRSKWLAGTGNVNPSKLISNGANSNNLLISGGTSDFAKVWPGWQIWVNNNVYNVVQKISDSSVIIDQQVTIAPAQAWKFRPNKSAGYRYVVAGGSTAFAALDYGHRVHFVTLNYDATVLYKINASHIIITDTASMLGTNDTFQFKVPIFKNIPLLSQITINTEPVTTRYLTAITDDFTATMDGDNVDLSTGYSYSITRNDAKLELNGGASTKMFIRANMDKNRPGLLFNRWTGSGDTYNNARIGQDDARSQGTFDLVFETGTDAGGNKDNVEEVVRITTTKRVGIGTTSPGDTLDVNGDIRVRGADIKDAGGTARITLTDNGRLDLKEDGGAVVLSVSTAGNVGIATTAPVSKLEVAGSLGVKVVTKTSAYTAADEAVILANASGGAFTITLPQASTVPGRVYTVKKIDNSYNVTIQGYGGTEYIDGATTLVLSSQWVSKMIVSNGTQWYVIADR
ncbi:MAG: hypothetical protein A2268_14075 [Candidatus Raymondbacteria bacterium RifOxyA12_full_50_37]|uniref:Rhamnogalacturonase A/B/Epimerase-like pectate lyase domain-containing protein n=1 Tax=Candidatus Raymondbacteria bacterium RIFOXYD12_FULL_49_13 TaxID=1817890 RepID=A0A1F7FLC1_UNCRA|nr:MAG: hypothetical protein A2268_14075 [Candidatus Raymondbacteria bacterium RifOxyA12_full_50_37]OGJ88206.1 MAG: hypothetical protein A2248_19415 [Candidatus Raymondbacteria bacterium RIFOXYA2_FULL_49_16]OGJ93979.1 MAG: hypothetical protein A2487_08840 [Candidatus Raymondbacteria bacterium RifOxyC12_full_50_8]OGJ94993.1 MAG: hypothetical protein A2350_09635 [Candidatus Raymondbacteria bacterium RifOxyB12_full_50_8]OGK07252.1 MAG: hypothetical protein A2519_14080 [Candidatus Raymondbacteria b